MASAANAVLTPSVPVTPAGGSTQPAATNPTSTPNLTRGVHAPTGGSGTGTTTTPSVPKVELPKVETPVGSTQVGGAVEKTVNDVTGTVNQAAGNVQETVNNVTGGLLTP